jgi:hypothetical protein
MHKNATKCNETLNKWCKNKHGASKIMDTLETYQAHPRNQHEENIIAPAKLQSYQITLLSFRLKILGSETNHPTSPYNLSLTQGMHKSSARKVILQNANKHSYNHSSKTGAVIEPVRLSVQFLPIARLLVPWFTGSIYGSLRHIVISKYF